MSYSANELALLLGIDSSWVRYWIREGKIQYHVEGKLPRIDIQDFADFLSDNSHLVGRLYLEEGYPYIDDFRKDLIDRISEISPRQ